MTLPPGPQSPHLVQAIQLKARPLRYLDACAQRYGDIFAAGGNGSPSVYVSNPSAIQEILAADRELFEPFHGDPVSHFLFGEGSIVFLQGEGHQRERRLLTPPLHGERLRANAEVINDVARRVIDRWRIGEPIPVGPAMREVTLRVIFRLLFNSDEGKRLGRLRDLFGSLMTSLNSPWSATLLRLSSRIGVPLGRSRSLASTKEEIDRLIYEEIRERRARSPSTGDDLLGLMMSAQSGAVDPATDREVHDEVMTLLFAGHETTASALAWALYWLHTSPDVHDKLRRELEARIDSTDATEIVRLPYLAALCQETLRLNPPCLSVLRVLKAPLEISRYRFAAGTTLIISIYLTHRRTDLYPRPDHFEPERFLGRQFSIYEYLPFGGGHRVCLGMSLALLEMKLVLATILSRWQLAPAHRGEPKHARRVLTAGPRGNMRLIPVRERTRRSEALSPALSV